jgi:hypothetical protein
MANFLEDIKKVLGDETPDAVAIGKYRGGYSDRGESGHPLAGESVMWEQIEDDLDYEYDAGFEGEDCHPLCHPLYIWTPTRVLFIGCYDGKTWVEEVPRYPRACSPYFVGG